MTVGNDFAELQSGRCLDKILRGAANAKRGEIFEGALFLEYHSPIEQLRASFCKEHLRLH